MKSELKKDLKERSRKCCEETIKVFDKYLPEMKASRDKDGQKEFEYRVMAVILLEMIHAGLLNDDE
jgi:hypothetical protein